MMVAGFLSSLLVALPLVNLGLWMLGLNTYYSIFTGRSPAQSKIKPLYLFGFSFASDVWYYTPAMLPEGLIQAQCIVVSYSFCKFVLLLQAIALVLDQSTWVDFPLIHLSLP